MPYNYKPTADLYLELTQSRLRELLDYDPVTGIFTRKFARGGKAAGSVAGSVNSEGYILLSVDRSSIRASRLAWFWMTGEWPASIVDHKNQIRSDNRWANLRLATTQQNNLNKKTKDRDFPRGVGRNGAGYYARIGSGSKITCSYGFSTPEEAHAEYLRMFREKYGVEFYPGYQALHQG